MLWRIFAIDYGEKARDTRMEAVAARTMARLDLAVGPRETVPLKAAAIEKMKRKSGTRVIFVPLFAFVDRWLIARNRSQLRS